MKIIPHECYLVLHRNPNDKSRTVKIYSSRAKALRGWGHSSRLSPLFPLKDVEFSSPTDYSFSKENTLVLLGPEHPEILLRACHTNDQAWISLGLYNNIVAPHNEESLQNLLSLIKKRNIPYEKWTITNSVIKNIEYWDHPLPDSQQLSTIETLVNRTFSDELNDAIQEYCPLAATTLARSVSVPKCIFEELKETNDYVAETLSNHIEDTPGNHYQSLGQILTINAGLARFSSQTFSGTSPVLETECHFWSHSLLGIGVATLAFRKIKVFLEKTLGEAKIPQRFAAYKQIHENVPDLSNDFPDSKDYLWDMTPNFNNSDKLLPLLNFYSARDGYRSTETTISAPLASVSSCNSPRWSLMTLTHEFSHVVVRAVLSDLYPDFSKQSEITRCLDLLREPTSPRSSLFDEILYELLKSILAIDRASHGKPLGERIPLNSEVLQNVLLKWRQEIDEIIVHVFDFLYFYGRDTERYVTGIWSSWGIIPNVSTRVHDYVIRTLSAVLVKHLRRPTQEGQELAKEQVLNALKKLQKSTLGGRYVDEAINLLENKWNNDLEKRLQARRQLVKITRLFLFSQTIATDIRIDKTLGAGTKGKLGYPFKSYQLFNGQIDNPLKFIEMNTESKVPNSIYSTWMLYILAFSCSNDK